jgi:flagellar basal-body rod protein FlgB
MVWTAISIADSIKCRLFVGGTLVASPRCEEPSVGFSGETVMPNLDRVLGAFPTAAALQARRLEVIAGNIANATTPNYRARDVDFRKVMAEVGDQSRLAVTHLKHIETPEQLTKDALMFRIPLAPSRDGNTVETHIEEAAYGDAAGRYLAALRFAEGALSGMRKAYRGD